MTNGKSGVRSRVRTGTKTREKVNTGIARKIGERILVGEFSPGSLLPNEAEWGKSFGASRTAVREAIKALSAKGLVSSRPKVGSRVEPRTRWNLLDRDVLAWHRNAVDRKVFLLSTQELRRLVEPGVAELAARKRTPQQLEQLQEALNSMKTATGHGNIVAADVSFHEALLACCNNELLIPFGILIEGSLAGLFDFTTSHNPRYKQALKLHEKIVRAVSTANPSAARRAMLALIEDTDDVIRSTEKGKKT